jgi:hypothetical protein
VGLLATFPNTDNMMCSLEEEATPRGGAQVRRTSDGGEGQKTVAWGGGGGGGGRRVEWETGSQLHVRYLTFLPTAFSSLGRAGPMRARDTRKIACGDPKFMTDGGSLRNV